MWEVGPDVHRFTGNVVSFGMVDSDELFVREDPIFAHKELFEITHLPERNRIVGRDTEITNIATAVNPAVFNQSPSNVLIYGKTGTGKSLWSLSDNSSHPEYVECLRLHIL